MTVVWLWIAACMGLGGFAIGYGRAERRLGLLALGCIMCALSGLLSAELVL